MIGHDLHLLLGEAAGLLQHGDEAQQTLHGAAVAVLAIVGVRHDLVQTHGGHDVPGLLDLVGVELGIRHKGHGAKLNIDPQYF